jgi:Flp pilus assembly protein protease CpaA
MPQPFPNLPFAVAFVGILIAGLAYAAWVDWTTLKVPKWLTVGLFAIGVVMNVIRGAWLGAEGQPTWLSDEGNLVLGALSGLLWSLAGFLLGFALFFVFWIFGLGGGGDVKLVAATGAWLGALPVMISIAASLPFLILVTLLVLTYRMTSGRLPQVATATAMQGGGRRRSVTTYSLPFALGVYVVLGSLMFGYVKALNAAAAG